MAVLLLACAVSTSTAAAGDETVGPAPAAPAAVGASTVGEAGSRPSDGLPLGEDFFDDDPFDEGASIPGIPDPIEPYNRAMFYINDKIYLYVFGPFLKVYGTAVPSPIRVGIRRFFQNLATPMRVVNNALQMKFADAGVELERFLINTTIGLGGFTNPAQDRFGLRMRHEDFGTTLGHYGAGPGFFIIWPVLGPSSARDTVGYAADLALYPPVYVFHDELLVALGIKLYEGFNEASLDLSTYVSLKERSFDPYVFFRDAYHQSRESKVRD